MDLARTQLLNTWLCVDSSVDLHNRCMLRKQTRGKSRSLIRGQIFQGASPNAKHEINQMSAAMLSQRHHS